MDPVNIIFILLLIIVIIFYYYDIFRYIKIHFDSDYEYIKNYKKLNKFNYTDRIVISLTTTPDRIQYIKPVIKSLLDQSVKVDQIVLNIPKLCKNKEYDIPKELNSMCNIFTCGKDYGQGTKFIPTILRETSLNTIIIMVDDDYIYGRNFIKSILSQYSKRNCAICMNEAILIKPEFIDTDVIYANKKNVNNDWIKKYIKSEKYDFEYNKNLRSFNV
uniref:Glycosyltransferase 2-like domain-containing protein n=1 Tax=viral metagenome TaxID=1070528 RepID=A0A6C0E1D0_9ZZZZ